MKQLFRCADHYIQSVSYTHLQNLESVAMLVTLENIRMRIIKNASEGRATWLYVVLNVKLFDGSFLTLFNAKDASSHHNI